MLNWHGIMFSGSGNHLSPGGKHWGPNVELKQNCVLQGKMYGKSMGTENGGIFQSYLKIER